MLSSSRKRIIQLYWLVIFCYFAMSASLRSFSRGKLTSCRSFFHQPRKMLCTSASVGSAMLDTDIFENKLPKKAKITFVLGGPGSGKGTQCERFASEFGITHLSAGELLRKEIQTGSPQGQIIDSFLKDGRIVPVEMSLSLLQKEIQQSGQQRFLIDGFPRNEDNLTGWMKFMPTICDIEMILFLQCNEEEMERRILSRALTSNRSDDNLQTAKKRFVTFQRDSLPVVEFFAKHKEYNLVNIEGSRNVDEVYGDVRKAFMSVLAKDLMRMNQLLTEGMQLNYPKEKLSGSMFLSNEALSNDRQVFDEYKLLASTFVVKEHVDISGLRGIYQATFADESKQKYTTIQRHWNLCKGTWTLLNTSVIESV